MRIVHICLGCFYVEGMGYQENIITKIHAQQGNEVYVLTSDFAFNGKGEAIIKEKKEYCNEYGVRVKILERSKGFIARYGKYDGLYNELLSLNPEIVFVHGGNFIGLKEVTRYCKKHSCKYYIDQHGDYYNSSVNNLKGYIIYKWLYGFNMRRAVPFVKKYWGVTPWRCQYLNDVIGIPKAKIDLLIMGGDDEKIRFDESLKIKEDVRKELSLTDKDFVIVTGGKIDRTKNIHLLMQAVSELEGKAKLIVFGQPNNEMENEITELSSNENIRFLGWIPSDKAYDYFLASDLAVFPGTHSVLWEQACACKVPCLVKRWEGMEHVNNGGNCGFLDDVSVEGLKKAIQELVFTEKYDRMLEVAQSDATDIFLYSKIAEKSLECVDQK